MKQCSKCKKTLPEEEFRYRSDNNRLYTQCKNCEKEYRKGYYQKHYKEKEKYRRKHKKHKKNYDKKYRQCHLEKRREWDKIYYQKTRMERLVYAKKYRTENPDKIEEYRTTHRIEIRAVENTEFGFINFLLNECSNNSIKYVSFRILSKEMRL